MIDIVLLYSGITKGMKSYGPKCIVPIGKSKTPLIVEQINLLKKNRNIDNVYIVLGFDAKKVISLTKDIKNNKVQFFINEEYENTNSGGSLLKILDKLNKTTLIFEDGILSYDTPKNKKSYIPLLSKQNKAYSIGSIVQDDKIKYLCYDLDSSWAEYVCICEDDIANAKTIINKCKQNINSMFLFEIINLLIDENIEFDQHILSCKKIKKIINHKVKA